MTQSKTYKSKIAAKFGILFSRIKNKFNGTKLVAESYTLKYNTTTKEYLVISVTMTEAEEQEFHIAIAEQQAKIMQMMIPTAAEPASPTLEQQAKAEKWAADVERNRQKQLAESKAKKKSAKKSVEMSEETAQEIVTELKRRGVYNGEPKAKKPAKSKTPKTPKVKVAKVKNKID
jgi:hypothetical protein